MILSAWNARRAGGRITITGHAVFADGSAGGPAKIVGVDMIQPRNGKIIAVDKNNEEHELRLN